MNPKQVITIHLHLQIPGSLGGHRICHAPAGALELGRGILAGQGLSCSLLVGMTKEALASLSGASLGVETCTSAEHGWWIGTKEVRWQMFFVPNGVATLKGSYGNS
jgi:hypothetical protein